MSVNYVKKVLDLENRLAKGVYTPGKQPAPFAVVSNQTLFLWMTYGKIHDVKKKKYVFKPLTCFIISLELPK